MEITNLLVILLIGLVIYYLNQSSNSNVTEGFKRRKGGIGKSMKKIGKSIKSVGKKKSKKSKSKGKSAGSSADGFNAAIIMVISKATDQSAVQATTEAYAAGLKTYFEEALKTNLKLTDAGAALSEEEFEAKVAEGIAAITSGGIKEFTKWFNAFASPPEAASTEESTEGSADGASEGSTEASE